MPVDFLTPAQRERYGRYPDTLSAEELARYFHLDDDDLEWIARKRRDSSRLGYALQLTTARFLGTFLDDPTAVPATVLHALATQLDVADTTCIGAYRQSEQRWRHTAEIRDRCSYLPFSTSGVQFRLGRWLCALCWSGTDRPSALFENAGGWLIGHKVLLPGVSILERFVSEVRSRMEARLWRRLVRGIDSEQRKRLDELLTLVDGSRQSRLDQLRKGPVRASGPALMQALRRIETVRGLGIKLPAAHVPPSRIAALARFASTVKVSAIARLPDDRRIATLAAFVHSLEASAHDDALDVLGLMLRELFAKAKKADTKARMRSLKDLDKAASVLAEACRMLLDPELPDGELRGLVYDSIGRDELAQALDDVTGLVRPHDDVFYRELSGKAATVARFLPTMLRVIQFDANPAAHALLQALDWLRERPDHEPPIAIVNKAWTHHVVRDDGRVDAPAFAFCALDRLRVAIRRRDVFVTPSWRYADPRAGLLAGTEWTSSKPPLFIRPIACNPDSTPYLPSNISALGNLRPDRAVRGFHERNPAPTACSNPLWLHEFSKNSARPQVPSLTTVREGTSRWSTAMQRTHTIDASVRLEASPPIIMRMPAVVRATGLARSTIYKLMAQKKFPHQVKIGPRAVGWRRTDLERWSEGQCTDAH
jgi:predicted DNA-binding transcriptional regulator AlpA